MINNPVMMYSGGGGGRCRNNNRLMEGGGVRRKEPGVKGRRSGMEMKEIRNHSSV